MPDTLCRLCNTKNSVFTSHFTCQSHKIVKHNQKIRRQQPTNCLSVFNHFVGLAFEGLTDGNEAKKIAHPFHVNVAFLPSLKTSENQMFLGGVKMEHFREMSKSMDLWYLKPP